MAAVKPDSGPPPWNVCLTHHHAYGGLHRCVNDFSRALSAPILSFDEGGLGHSPQAVGEPPAGPGIHTIPCQGGPFLRGAHRLSRRAAAAAEALTQHAPWLVCHSLFRAHNTWVEGWSGRHRRPYWAVPHGCLDPWGLKQRALVKRLWLSWVGTSYFQHASRVIFATTRELEKAARWVSQRQSVVIPWPVTLPDEGGRDRARQQWRQRLSLPADARVLLFVGRLHSMKRPRETIEAFCRAMPQRTHLVMVGMDGDLSREGIAASVPEAVAGRVHVVGPLHGNALTEAYLGSDGFVSLSFRENFGYSTADALASGIPVILSPGNDLGPDVEMVDCGWLLPNDSREAAVEAMSGFDRSSEPRLRAMGRAGRMWASDTLSRERFEMSLRHLPSA